MKAVDWKQVRKLSKAELLLVRATEAIAEAGVPYLANEVEHVRSHLVSEITKIVFEKTGSKTR